MLRDLEAVLVELAPDSVLVYGDTNSTLAGALAAAKMHIPVLHVEAGLRSFNRTMPEEINRTLTDQLADLLFVPTDRALVNLRREGICPDRIHKVGDVMYDAALYYGAKAEQDSPILSDFRLGDGDYALATIHRAENTDDLGRLRVICKTLARLTEHLPVVLPLHPRTRKVLEHHGLLKDLRQVHVADPIGYLDMLMLEKSARIVITDSGGVQKEAFFFQRPCVTFREETEWLELVDLGWNRLAPPVSVESQMREIETALKSSPSNGHRPFGSGKTAERIAKIVASMEPQPDSVTKSAVSQTKRKARAISGI
jgi:UDP-GlcNAc3NAcA epimerase